MDKYTTDLLKYLPTELVAPEAGDASKIAQIVKQFFIIKAGISVSHHGELPDSEQWVKAMDEYNQWCLILDRVYPDNVISPFMQYTTATRKKDMTGRDIMAKYGTGLRVIGNEYNAKWNQVLSGQTSGCGPEDLWRKFLKAIFDKRNESLQ